MTQWVWSGLATRVRTTRYPARQDQSPGASPGFPLGRALADSDPGAVVDRCPTGALVRRDRRIWVDPRRCVHCYRCAHGEDALEWRQGYEWATVATTSRPAGEERTPQLRRAFARSLHVRVVDAGDCGACLHEVKQLANPYYNAHRLGFFFTPTPRHADILMVVGPGTDQMRTALEKAYTALPTPRRVIAVGACALSGSVFGPSFACSDGVRSIVPVDIEVPGSPPPPFAILHALLVATGRAQPAGWAAGAEWTARPDGPAAEEPDT
jgi:Ni,Fe-hydrogenase III small subunit